MKKRRKNVAAVIALLLALCTIPAGCAQRAQNTQELSALTQPQPEEETAEDTNSVQEAPPEDLESGAISEEEASSEAVTPGPSTPGIAPLDPSETAPDPEDVPWVIS